MIFKVSIVNNFMKSQTYRKIGSPVQIMTNSPELFINYLFDSLSFLGTLVIIPYKQGHSPT